MRGNKDYALGRMKAGKMNQTESAYAQRLEQLKACGEVLWYRFEGITLKLADNCRYTPDFIVMSASGQLECHEVKGYFRDDSKVKIKVAAEQFPMLFKLVFKRAKKDGGGFKIEEV